MGALATITSKRQLTIPVQVFRKVGFTEGEKVVVMEKNGALYIRSALAAIEDLAGSVKIPKKFQGKKIDEIITAARYEHYSKKYSKKG